MTVRLPKFSKPFEVGIVDVSVPVFNVNIGDINVKPKTFSVRSAVGNVLVNVGFCPRLLYDEILISITFYRQSVRAGTSDIGVDSGSIQGNFTVTESLVLKTAAGSIAANVSMLSSATEYQQPPTIASIKTNKGSIDTRFSLSAIDAEDDVRVPSGGFFHIDTKSDASPIRVKFDDAPIDSTLVLTSKTSVGSINVDLHPTYEGDFSLSSDVSSPVVNAKEEVEDPAGEGRKRTVKFVHSRGHLKVGEVTWGSARVDGSRVDLRTDVGTPRLSL